MRPAGVTIAAADLIGKIGPSIEAFLLSLSDDGLDCFDEGEGDPANAQRAERYGLVSISAWKGGWQVRLTELGRELREILAKEGTTHG